MNKEPVYVKNLFEDDFWDKLVDYLTCYENLNTEYKEYFTGIKGKVEKRECFSLVDLLEINIIASKEYKLKFEEYKNIIYHNHKLYHILLEQFRIMEEINKSCTINNNKGMEITLSEQFYKNIFIKIIEEAKNIEINKFKEILINYHPFYSNEIENFDNSKTLGFIRYEFIFRIVYFLLDFILHLKKHLILNINSLMESYYRFDLPDSNNFYSFLFPINKNKKDEEKDYLYYKKLFINKEISSKTMQKRVKGGNRGKDVIKKDKREQLLSEYYDAYDILGIMHVHNINDLDDCCDFLDELNQNLSSYIFENRDLFFGEKYICHKSKNFVIKKYIKNKYHIDKYDDYFDKNILSKASDNLEKNFYNLNKSLNTIDEKIKDNLTKIEKIISKSIFDKYKLSLENSINDYLEKIEKKEKTLEDRIILRDKLKEIKELIKNSILISEYSKPLLYIHKLNSILTYGMEKEDYSYDDRGLANIINKLDEELRIKTY